MKVNILICFCVICILASGCKEDVLPPQTDRVGFDFFPLELGLFRIYDVKRVDFTLISSDTNHFQLKEAVIDSFLNAENDYTYILHRSTRGADSLEWELDSVWTARRTGAFAVIVENNVPIIKLVFPVDDTKEWDGNSLNSKAEKQFRITDISVPLVLPDTIYDETVTVIQSEIEDNLIIQDERREVYVKGIGLAHKDFVVLNFCPDSMIVLAKASLNRGRYCDLI